VLGAGNVSASDSLLEDSSNVAGSDTLLEDHIASDSDN
jgi:hypothetical protein